MSLNLIEIAREHLSEDTLKLIAEKAGLEPDQASGVIGKAFPSLLALFGERAKSEEGAEALFNSVKDADSGILDNLSDSFSGDTSSLQEGGKNLLSGVFGEDKLPSIFNKVGLASGVSGEKAEGVLGMLTPYLGGLLGKQVKEEGLEVSSFQNMLKSQEGAISGVLGSGFLDKLGFAGLATGIGGALAGGGAGITNALGGIGDKVTDTAGGIGDKVSESINSVGGKVTDVTDGIGEKISGTLGPAGDKITEGVSGIGEKVSDAACSLGEKASDTVGSLGEKASDAACSLGDKATDAMGSLGDKASDAVGSVTAGVSGAGAAIAAKTGDAVDKVGDVASSATSGAATATANAGGGFMKWLPLLLIPILLFLAIKKCSGVADSVEAAGDAVTDGAKSVTTAVVDGAKGAGEAIGDGASSVGDAVAGGVDAAGGALSDGVEALGEGASTVGDAVAGGVDAAGGALSDGVEALGEGASTVGDAVAGGVDAAGEALSGGVDAISEGAVDGLKSIGTTITEGVGSLGEAAADGVGAIAEGSGNLGEGTKAAGGAVIGAIIGGAKATGEAIGDGAAAAGNAIADGAGAAGEAVASGASVFGVPTDGPQLSEKVQGFATKLNSIDASDESKLDEVYSEFTKDGSSGFLYRIPFSTGETGVPSSHQEALVAKLKTANPEATLVTIGYADVRGDDAQNKTLSYGRAKEVGEWITSTLGSDTSIESFSMGETDRFSKSDYSKNRVVEVWQVTE